MEIIDFNKAKKSKTMKLKKHHPNEKFVSGEFGFTCPTCNTRSTVSTANMVFLDIKFCCSSCGEKFTVSNPRT